MDERDIEDALCDLNIIIANGKEMLSKEPDPERRHELREALYQAKLFRLKVKYQAFKLDPAAGVGP